MLQFTIQRCSCDYDACSDIHRIAPIRIYVFADAKADVLLLNFDVSIFHIKSSYNVVGLEFSLVAKLQHCSLQW